MFNLSTIYFLYSSYSAQPKFMDRARPNVSIQSKDLMCLWLNFVLLLTLNNDSIPKGAKKSEFMEYDAGVDNFLFELEKEHLSCKEGRSGEGSTQMENQK